MTEGSAARDVVALREYIEALILAESKLREELARANARALELQAAEYARHLEALNGKADELRRMQATYVPRELFDARRDQMDRWMSSVDRQLTRTAMVGTMALIALGAMPFVLRVLGVW